MVETTCGRGDIVEVNSADLDDITFGVCRAMRRGYRLRRGRRVSPDRTAQLPTSALTRQSTATVAMADCHRRGLPAPRSFTMPRPDQS